MNHKLCVKRSKPVYYKIGTNSTRIKAWVKGRRFVYSERFGWLKTIDYGWFLPAEKFFLSSSGITARRVRTVISLPAGIPPLPQELTPK